MRKKLTLSIVCISIFIMLPSLTVAATAELISPEGGDNVPGGVRIVVDAYGAIVPHPNNSYLNNAWFNNGIEPLPFDTTEASAIFVNCGSGFTGFLSEEPIGSSGGIPSSNFLSTTSNSATSDFFAGDMYILLEQEVEDIKDQNRTKVGSVLIQKYTVTNTATYPISFSITKYHGSNGHFDLCASHNSTVPSMNQNLSAAGATIVRDSYTTDYAMSFFIRLWGGHIPNGVFEIDYSSNLVPKIINGNTLSNSPTAPPGVPAIFPAITGTVGMALQRDFFLAPNKSRVFVARNEFYLPVGNVFEGVVPTIHKERQVIPPPGLYIPRPNPGLGPNDLNLPGLYDIEFTETLELKATVNVFLTGAAPEGPNNQDLKIVWERGIETAWSGQYLLKDQDIWSYPIVVDVNFVNSALQAHFTVEVIEGDGRTNSTHFYTHDPNMIGNEEDEITYDYQAIVAAHEAGHWFGLYDEYHPTYDANAKKEAPKWPLYNSSANIILDWHALYYNRNSNPDLPPDWVQKANWEQLIVTAPNGPVDESGLMGKLGSMKERYYRHMADWLTGKTNRTFVLGYSPLFIERDPFEYWPKYENPDLRYDKDHKKPGSFLSPVHLLLSPDKQ